MAIILIIDELSADRDTFAAALRAAGHNVLAVPDASTAEKPLQGLVDVIVLSSGLPGEGGISLLRRVRANERTASIPVLVVCPEGRVDHVVEAARAGADDVLARPVDAVALARGVASLAALASLRRGGAEEAERERRYRELESFVYLISHDLKTPIVSIQGIASILLGEAQEKLPDKARDYVRRVQANAERIEELVRDLLDYPRIQSMVSDPEPVQAREIIERALNGLQEKIQATQAEIRVPDALPEIQCDRRRIQQVLHNLIENAIKYTPEDRTPRIEIGYRDQGETHEFAVRDNGSGIAPDEQDRAFHLHQRLSSSKGTEGMGIGLAVTRQIVERHGGRIWCEPLPGTGTVFFFTLPKSMRKKESPAGSST